MTITEKDLEPNEYICDKCKGERYIDTINPEGFTDLTLCDKCGGDGKVDWVTNICGRQPEVSIKEFDLSHFASPYNAGKSMMAANMIEKLKNNKNNKTVIIDSTEKFIEVFGECNEKDKT